MGSWLRGNSPKPGRRGVPRRPGTQIPLTGDLAPSTEGDLQGTPPKALEPEAAAVWAELAPTALQEHTLTSGTAPAFAWLCRLVVLERKLAVGTLTSAGPDHRGVMARIESLMARFRVVPDGKPVLAHEPPKDEFAEFDSPRLVKGGT